MNCSDMTWSPCSAAWWIRVCRSPIRMVTGPATVPGRGRGGCVPLFPLAQSQVLHEFLRQRQQRHACVDRGVDSRSPDVGLLEGACRARSAAGRLRSRPATQRASASPQTAPSLWVRPRRRRSPSADGSGTHDRGPRPRLMSRPAALTGTLRRPPAAREARRRAGPGRAGHRARAGRLPLARRGIESARPSTASSPGCASWPGGEQRPHEYASLVTPDETGWRIGGERYWLWVFTTPETTVYAICPGRGFDDAATVLGTDYAGVLVRDGWAPYRR